MTQPILQIEDLRTHFFTDRGEIPAVDGVSLHVHAGEVLGVVGESGCGKSVTSLSVLRLIPSPPGKIVGGAIRFKERDILRLKEREMRGIRGNAISMIFQEPMTSLNPLFTVGQQIREAVSAHRGLGKKEARAHTVDMLRKVGIPRPESIIDEYPHQLSGGMRQRVMIAMAISCGPELLIADEPTTALDVTIQAQILDLIRRLNEENGTAVMMITHDLGVVAEMCDRVAVMYAGKVVEEGTVRHIFKNPLHPYTQGLIQSVPRMNEQRRRLFSIPGHVPILHTQMRGCRFADRCQHVMPACYEQLPELVELEAGHRSRCLLHEVKFKEDVV
ncbi:ABC transporter ATP-binding protein [Paenibacillus campinasensis]|uniref:ATP-binding cassette domain-containing protein n=1 Tax=Paenibacillus campinasensis TaxID=66347 RepID=A0A268EUZ0_9BACL|nr:ABC transporter ATP-binding protein [Paenibacillus campinasensis]MUG68573.1 ATP-binding cassette domain-containing protein [Paenibacillus campinasensis]PAD76939.1 peptide ABC transporter ATP-binding protein [Paenibacillus campinasensis]